tara:strand:+ start:985 stop:2175 length:1191 start_codon:yes stop_codon:yes gene_type:complete
MKWPLMKNSISFDMKKVMSDFIYDDVKFTNGEKVKEFERQWAEWVGTDYALYVNSGGSANLLLLDAVMEKYFIDVGGLHTLNRPPVVLAPSCTWGTTIAPLMQLGYDIRYCDIDTETYSFCEKDMKRIRNEIKNEGKLGLDIVWITHLLGSPCNIDRIKKIFPKSMILEDCCESHGATFNGQKVGTFGVGSTFSFYFGHHMTTVEGGMINTDDKELYELMRIKRSHGLARESSPEVFEKIKAEYPDLDGRFLFPTTGYNLRNQEINAVLGIEQLKKLDEWIDIRKDNLKTFNNILNKFTDQFHTVYETGNSSYALAFVCKESEIKEKLESHLASNGIETRPFLVGNILRQPFIKHKKPESFTNAEFLHNNAFYIGNNQFIKKVWFEELEQLIRDII